MTRIIAYIDGFNLYFGLKSKGWKKYYWLNLMGLVRSLLKPGQTLVEAHYFTARIRLSGNNHGDMQRQADYLDALSTLPGLTIHYGHYLQKSQQCRQCGAAWTSYEEKMTDVNIAVQLLADAFDDRFDTALILSGDSDLTTPVHRVRGRFPQKRVVIAFPPDRYSDQLKRAANGYFTIGEDKLRQNQLPDPVVAAGGFAIHHPARWR